MEKSHDDRVIEYAEEHDLSELMKRLLAFANKRIRLCWWKGVMAGGLTAEDIVQHAFSEVIQGKRKWSSDLGLDQLLMGIIHREISKALELKENKLTVNIPELSDPESNTSYSDTLPSKENNPIETLIKKGDETIYLEIIECLEDGSHEQLIMEAIFDGCKNRREIIERSEIRARDYDNAKKRLKTFLSKEWQKKLENLHI